MIATIIVILSIALNVIAALFALRLSWNTRWGIAWLLIAAGLGLMAVQRTIPFYDMLMNVTYTAPNLTDALVSLVVGLLLVAGVALVAPLIQTFKQHEELRDVLNERTTIIQGLHEEILRSLQQIHISLEVGKPSSLTLSQVSGVTHTIQSFMEDMKAGLLVGNRFGTALRSLVEDMTHEGRLPIHVEIDSAAAVNLTKEQGTQLLHITREALSNSQKHAHAKKGRVTFRARPKSVALEVIDNGRGFEVDLVEAQGHGLGNMVARARKIGARLKIHSRPKQGTRIQIEVPLNGTPTTS